MLQAVETQIAVTKRKDDEESSSTIYNGMDQFDPVLDFDKYITDDERIVDEVCNIVLNCSDCTTSSAGHTNWPLCDDFFKHLASLLIVFLLDELPDWTCMLITFISGIHMIWKVLALHSSNCTGHARDPDAEVRNWWLFVGSDARRQLLSVSRFTLDDVVRVWLRKFLGEIDFSCAHLCSMLTGLGCLGDGWSDDGSAQWRHSSDTNCRTTNVLHLAAFQLFRCRPVSRVSWRRSRLGQEWSITSWIQEAKSSTFRVSTSAGQKVRFNAVLHFVLSSAVFVRGCVHLHRCLHTIEKWHRPIDVSSLSFCHRQGNSFTVDLRGEHQFRLNTVSRLNHADS